MRKLALLALLALPAWPNACTLSSTYALSASGGHWSGTGCTGGSYIPGNGDTVTLGGSITLTVDQAWTIGASGAINTTPAISTGLTGKLVVNGGVTLTLRGDLLWTYNNNSVVAAAVMNAGSTLIFDSSQASSPTTTRYRVGPTGSNNTQIQYFAANGTAGSHVTITSVNTNGALNGQFRGGSASVGSVPTGYMPYFTATYTDFSNIGDMATNGESFAAADWTTDPGTWTMTHCTFNNVGPWWSSASSNFSVIATVNISNNVWTNSPCATAAQGCLPLNNGSAASGTYLFRGNVLDFCVGGQGIQQVLFDWSGSYFGRGTCGALASAITLTNLFNRQVLDAGQAPLAPGGNLTGGYYFLDREQDNPHWTQYGPSTTISGYIFDEPDDVISDSGEIFNWQQGGTNTATEGFNNNILVPTKTGSSNSEMASLDSTQPSDTNLTFQEFHNTWVGHTFANGSFGMQDINEGGASLVPIANLESNLAWSNGGGYYKVETISTAGSLLQNAVTTADYNYADANAIQSIPACSVCTNQGRSYTGEWTATPGAHDVDVLQPTVRHPYLADTSRNLASWDTAYLGHALGTAWASGTGYTLGQIVSSASSGYLGAYKTGVNFRAVAAHISTAYDAPLSGYYTIANGGLTSITTNGSNILTVNFAVAPGLTAGNLVSARDANSPMDNPAYVVASVLGNSATLTACSGCTASHTYTDAAITVSTWRNWWEWASLYDIRTAIAAGTTYTDGAIGCAGCGPTQALVAWVQKGFVPQAPGLWCAGHDGQTVGAVPFCASGKVMLGALAGL